MDADPKSGEDIKPFLHIGTYLNDCDLSAPHILNFDETLGLILMEDFGNALFSDVVERDPRAEKDLYFAASECLHALQQHPPAKNLICATPNHLANMISPAYEFYCDTSNGMDKAIEALGNLLSEYADDQSVTILRDFHAQNLIWLPERIGVKRVGLLDFQDALVGPKVYDLISLTRDARRNLGEGIANATHEHFRKLSGMNEQDFAATCAVVAVQRNLRILGIFARLCTHAGKASYIDLIPRVWRYLLDDLKHPVFQSAAPIFLSNLPEPTTEFLLDLKSKCPAQS